MRSPVRACAWLLLVTGCQNGPPPPTAAQIEEARLLKAAASAKAALSDTLVDPDSVRFRDVTIAPSWIDADERKARGARKAPFAMCGIVNARNRMGGYSGFSPFVVRQKDADDFSDAEIIIAPAADSDRFEGQSALIRFDCGFVEHKRVVDLSGPQARFPEAAPGADKEP